jgi:hypothetical protein
MEVSSPALFVEIEDVLYAQIIISFAARVNLTLWTVDLLDANVCYW